MGMGFREMLKVRQKKSKTLVCVGLDPLVEKMPAHFKGGRGSEPSVARWMMDVAAKTAPFASMFKLQKASWEALGIYGLAAMKDVIECIKTNFFGIPVFLDGKCGDIARTQKQYGVAAFDIYGADGMNFSPYMGRDCMAALVDKEKWAGKGLVGLCYTSNPDARQVQDFYVAGAMIGVEGCFLWEYFAQWILEWAEQLNVLEDTGLVMAAAYNPNKDLPEIHSRHLTRCRKIVGGKLWFLIPGIGAQGGFIEETVRTAYAGPGSIAINSSSDIIFNKDPAAKAKQLCDAINRALPV